MKPQIGSKLSVAIAQNGIFLRLFAAAMNAGSGLGGGGAAGAARAGVAAGCATAAAADASTFAGVAVVAGASAGADSPSSAARRSLDRFSRCSGISVTGFLSPRQRRDAHE